MVAFVRKLSLLTLVVRVVGTMALYATKSQVAGKARQAR